MDSRGDLGSRLCNVKGADGTAKEAEADASASFLEGRK